MVPVLPVRAIAECHRCDRVLDRRRWTRFDISFASAVATFLLLPPAFLLPLMESTIRNIVYQRSRLVSSVPEIYREVVRRHPGRVLTRTTIAEHVWDYTFDSTTNVIDVYVKNLRKKIDADWEPKLLHTVRGAGYVLKVL